MRKLGLIISALALVLGLSQCAKKPNMPTFGGVEPSTKTITFTTSGGAKGDFDQNGGLLNYKWDEDDVLHVYLQNTASENFTGGDHLGEMHIVSMADDYSATFEGTFTAPFPKNGWIRFVHCGNEITVTNEGNTDFVDFSTQDGDKETVSSKVIAVCDQQITEDCTFKFEGCNLNVQFSVVKFSFEKFTDKTAVALSGIKENKLKVNADGTVTYDAGSASTLENVNDVYYTVFMPKANTSYKFTSNGEVAYKKATITNEGTFYSTAAGGNSIVLDLIPENALKEGFSVNEDGDMVLFSKSNLWYGPLTEGAQSTMNFEEHQWDPQSPIIDNWDPNHVFLFLWSKNQDVAVSKTTSEVGADDDIFFTNETYTTPKSSFVVSGQTGIWRTLSKDEWSFLINRKLTDGVTCSYAAGVYGNGIKGYLFFPDNWDKDAEYAGGIVYGTGDFTNTVTDEILAQGAAFLPCAGSRDENTTTSIYNVYLWANYWSSNPADAIGGITYAHYLTFNKEVVTMNELRRGCGYSIRLVTDIK